MSDDDRAELGAAFAARAALLDLVEGGIVFLKLFDLLGFRSALNAAPISLHDVKDWNSL
jgi:hypothetical protein